LAGNRTRDKGGDTTRSKTDDYAHNYYYQQNDFDTLDRVVELAKRLDTKPAQVALAWMLHKPVITAPIIGASKAPHLQDAIEAMAIKLSAEDVAYLEEPYTPHPVFGHA